MCSSDLQRITEGKGVGIIIDCVGGSYFQQNLASLSIEGRLVIIGWLSGTQVPHCDLSMILRKRIRVEGSTLRARDVAYKALLAENLKTFCLPRFLDGRMKVFIDRTFSVSDIQKAHQYMEQDLSKGKIILDHFDTM